MKVIDTSEKLVRLHSLYEQCEMEQTMWPDRDDNDYANYVESTAMNTPPLTPAERAAAEQQIGLLTDLIAIGDGTFQEAHPDWSEKELAERAGECYSFSQQLK